jgi:hypothetical protein
MIGFHPAQLFAPLFTQPTSSVMLRSNAIFHFIPDLMTFNSRFQVLNLGVSLSRFSPAKP